MLGDVVVWPYSRAFQKSFLSGLLEQVRENGSQHEKSA